MKITNAIKKLTKAGFTVTERGYGMFVAKKAGLTHHVQFNRNGRDDAVARSESCRMAM